MKLQIEIDEKTLKQLVIDHLASLLGNYPFSVDSLRIEVKSKQNYRSEWEEASYRATYSHIE